MIALLVRRQERLTGNLRGRRQWLTGKIVLQVEVVQQISTNIAPCPPPPWCLDVDAWKRQQAEKDRQSWREVSRFWRDALQSEALPAITFSRVVDEASAQKRTTEQQAMVKQLAADLEHRALRRFMDADASDDPIDRKLLEHSALCYANTARELLALLGKEKADPKGDPAK